MNQSLIEERSKKAKSNGNVIKLKEDHLVQSANKVVEEELEEIVKFRIETQNLLV